MNAAAFAGARLGLRPFSARVRVPNGRRVRAAGFPHTRGWSGLYRVTKDDTRLKTWRHHDGFGDDIRYLECHTGFCAVRLCSQDSATLPENNCSEELPALICTHNGLFRLEPVILMPSGRFTRTSVPDENEINPFSHGRVDFDVQMAGLDATWHLFGGKMKVGFNTGIGVTEHEIAIKDSQEKEKAALAIWSASLFVQARDVVRVEWGAMRAKSGRVAARVHNDREDLEDPNDKVAVFIGVSFPAVSSGIRKILAKLD